MAFRPRRPISSVALGLLLTAVVPATAFGPGMPAAGADEFLFHPASNYDSVLTFSSASLDRSVILRAGSGTVTDECLINFGWLPRGTYDVQAHDTDLEGSIAGYAWELSDQQCYDGTFRTNLLVHSEMSPYGGQDDTWEPNTWTFSDPDDYASFGCIKVSYPDMLALEQSYEQAEQFGTTVSLRVE